MDTIGQKVTFTPLVDAILNCVQYLNEQGITGSLEVIGRNIHHDHPDTEAPSMHLMQQCLKTLVKNGRLEFRGNRGYFIANSDDTSRARDTSPESRPVSRTVHGQESLDSGACSDLSAHGTLLRGDPFDLNSELGGRGDGSGGQASPDPSSTHHSSLRRSRSLRIPSAVSAEKVKKLDEKASSFRRSKSFRVNRDKNGLLQDVGVEASTEQVLKTLERERLERLDEKNGTLARQQKATDETPVNGEDYDGQEKSTRLEDSSQPGSRSHSTLKSKTLTFNFR